MRNRPLSPDEQADLQSKVLEGAAAKQFADFARSVVIVDQERGIRKRMFDAIDSEEPLNPIKAAQAWIELRAAYKLVHRLETIAKTGVSAQNTLARSPNQPD